MVRGVQSHMVTGRRHRLYFVGHILPVGTKPTHGHRLHRIRGELCPSVQPWGTLPARSRRCRGLEPAVSNSHRWSLLKALLESAKSHFHRPVTSHPSSNRPPFHTVETQLILRQMQIEAL